MHNLRVRFPSPRPPLQTRPYLPNRVLSLPLSSLEKVTIAQPSLESASLPPRQAGGAIGFPGMPAVPPSVSPGAGAQAGGEEKAGDAVEMLGGPEAPGAAGGAPGGEGLRKRVVPGAGGQR